MNNPHPNEIKNAQERRKLQCHGYGDAEARPEDEDLGGNFVPDRIEANKAWWDRKDWEVPGNGGTNDYLFEDNDE